MNDELIIWLRSGSVIRDHDFARAWLLYNYPKPDSSAGETSIKSLKAFVEFDCKGGRSRMLSKTYYSEWHGAGQAVLTSEKPTEWSYAPPDTLEEGALKRVCGEEEDAFKSSSS